MIVLNVYALQVADMDNHMITLFTGCFYTRKKFSPLNSLYRHMVVHAPALAERENGKVQKHPVHPVHPVSAMEGGWHGIF